MVSFPGREKPTVPLPNARQQVQVSQVLGDDHYLRASPHHSRFVGFIVPLEFLIFHSYGDVTITGEGLQILTYARHLTIEQW